MRISNNIRNSLYNKRIINSGNLFIKKLALRLISKKIILVLGCQRSGTTLLYMLLSSHPSIIGYNEDELKFSFPRLRIILRSAKQDKYSCFKLPTKTPELKNFQDEYKHSEIFWIIRHPYSVVSSMRSLIMPHKGENWLKVHGREELERHSKIFPEINKIDFERIDEVTLGSYIYKYKIMTLEKYEEKKLNISIVRFEDLVQNVKETLTPILIKIGLSWSESILFHNEHHKGRIYCGNNIGSRPIDKSRLKPRWNLSQEEKEKIKNICDDCITKHYPDELY